MHPGSSDEDIAWHIAKIREHSHWIYEEGISTNNFDSRGYNEDVATDYMSGIENAPPIIAVDRDVIDGSHRLQAARLAGVGVNALRPAPRQKR